MMVEWVSTVEVFELIPKGSQPVACGRRPPVSNQHRCSDPEGIAAIFDGCLTWQHGTMAGTGETREMA